MSATAVLWKVAAGRNTVVASRWMSESEPSLRLFPDLEALLASEHEQVNDMYHRSDPYC
jgi:hypothetical protein